MSENKLEIVENKLEVIVKESGLEATKAKILLENFKDYFNVAVDIKRKRILSLKVTSEQVHDGKVYLN